MKAAAVGQLHGGIHRFLEEWPDGGDVWTGKNLVFDKRTAIGTSPPSRVPYAVCDLCDEKVSPSKLTVPLLHSLFHTKSLPCCWAAKDCDDYSAGARCRYCRARLLVCTSCTAALQSGSDHQAAAAGAGAVVKAYGSQLTLILAY